MARTYTVVFSLIDWDDDVQPKYRTITVHATGYNNMLAQVRELIEPAGYHYIGTRDDNQWYHPRIGRRPA